MPSKRIKRFIDKDHLSFEISKRWNEFQSKFHRKENKKLLDSYKDKGLKHPPIFVIGPPRSGTTLFYQLMVHRYHFAYIQNQMAFYRYAMAWYTQSRLNVFKPYVSDFESSLGRTNQDVGPNGALFFWDQFFPERENDYYGDFSFSEKDAAEIRATIAFLTEHFDLPFISKNLKLALAIKPILETFPEAIFIRVIRDPRAIASSIKDARIKAYGNDKQWRLMKPNSYPGLMEEPAHMQIAKQVSEILSAVKKDLPQNSKTIDVQYEDFCDSPDKYLQKVENQLKNFGVSLKSRNKELPKNFDFKKTVNFSESEIIEINTWFESQDTYSLAPKRISLQGESKNL